MQLGMLDIERPPDSRRVYYVRTTIALWEAIGAVIEAIESDGSW
ncbi:hypothetical protein MAUB1S_11903 [Mycolicibacterium aubagnense]